MNTEQQERNMTERALNFEQKSLLNQFSALYEKEDLEYLSKSNIHTRFLHDLLNQLLIHQPEDVVGFVQQHFAHLKKENNKTLSH